MTTDILFNGQDAAKYLGISYSTFSKNHMGKIAFVSVGHRKLYTKEVLDERFDFIRHEAGRPRKEVAG